MRPFLQKSKGSQPHGLSPPGPSLHLGRWGGTCDLPEPGPFSRHEGNEATTSWVSTCLCRQPLLWPALSPQQPLFKFKLVKLTSSENASPSVTLVRLQAFDVPSGSHEPAHPCNTAVWKVHGTVLLITRATCGATRSPRGPLPLHGPRDKRRGNSRRSQLLAPDSGFSPFSSSVKWGS